MIYSGLKQCTTQAAGCKPREKSTAALYMALLPLTPSREKLVDVRVEFSAVCCIRTFSVLSC